jgi:membrane protease YdiL (CAAX protease family)
MKAIPRNKIITFLCLTFLISSIFYYLIISAGSLNANNGIFVFLLMWTPGLAGITTQLIFEHSLKGLGWKPGKINFLFLAYFIPLGYCLVVYGITWLAGFGIFPSPDFAKTIQQNYPGVPQNGSIPVYALTMATIGFTASLFSALGEEIGWRGFFVPELAKIMSFPRVALISGFVWSIWHLPLIFFSDYNLPGVPAWYAGLMFMILAIGISFVFAWLRLKSGSLWTAVILHASHNIFIQAIFTPLTGLKPVTPYIIDEFGCGLALAAIMLAFVFWKKQKELPPTGYQAGESLP